MRNKTPPTENADLPLGADGASRNIESPNVVNGEDKETDYLQLARSAYESSTDYYNANLRQQWERNISNFNSKHPAGSKYYSLAYLNRSKMFRPKTRASIRQNEAAAVAAFFSTRDVVSISAEDTKNPESVMSADLLLELVNYRLTGSTIPWYKIVIATIQDAMVMDACICRIEWKYEQRETDRQQLVGKNEDGSLKYEPVKEVIADHPEITPIPNENIRIAEGASFLDPIGSSPYVIELIPMYVQDVKKNMKGSGLETGEPKWYPASDAQLLGSVSENIWDSTRQARQDGKEDPTDPRTSITNHTQVWIHRIIMEIDGVDMQWYTLGTAHLLSDPVPLDEVVLHGMRPYVSGTTVIEAHRLHPSALAQLGQELQAGSNENFNQRFDNVKLILNQRNLVKRAASIDLRTLKKSIPGSNIMTNNPESDVKPLVVQDATSSSYQEQDRMSADFDEIMGNFSQSSVSTNRKMNETVGGMGMIKDNANAMTEYIIRTYAETFVEQVIRHLVALEKAYETNPKVLQLAADRTKDIKEGTQVTPDMLQHSVDVSVDAGFGSTDPVRKLERFTLALQTVSAVPGLVGKLKEEEVVQEVFGNAGFKNGERFFTDLGEEAAAPQPSFEEQIRMKELELEEAKLGGELSLKQNELLINREIKYAEMAQVKEMKLGELYQALGVKSGELDLQHRNHDLDVIKEMGKTEERQLKRDELTFKATTGKDGI